MLIDDNRHLTDMGINSLFKIIFVGVGNYDLCCITIYNKCINVDGSQQSIQFDPSNISRNQSLIAQHLPRRRENSAPSIDAIIESLENAIPHSFMEEEWMEDRKNWKRSYRNS